MQTYLVTIRATITKTYEIEADNPETADEIAQEIFTTKAEKDVPEDYDQETLFVEKKS